MLSSTIYKEPSLWLANWMKTAASGSFTWHRHNCLRFFLSQSVETSSFSDFTPPKGSNWSLKLEGAHSKLHESNTLVWLHELFSTSPSPLVMLNCALVVYFICCKCPFNKMFNRLCIPQKGASKFISPLFYAFFISPRSVLSSNSCLSQSVWNFAT